MGTVECYGFVSDDLFVEVLAETVDAGVVFLRIEGKYAVLVDFVASNLAELQNLWLKESQLDLFVLHDCLADD